MSDNVAGTVNIEIGGNISPFEVALEKARQIAIRFDAQISQKLSGSTSAGMARIAEGVEKTNVLLERLTGSAKSSASALSGITDEATKTNAAMTAASTSTTKLTTALATNMASTRAGFVGLPGVVGEVAKETEHLGSAGRLGAAQMMSLQHSARSAVESLALGVPVSQALAAQMNHLSFAMTGPQGLLAATAASRAAFGGWLASVPGLLTVGGVAAVAAVAGYVLTTRESIKSVDEILEGHKALLDEIANTYPHLTSELQKYQQEAAKLPNSVVSADATRQIENTQRALSASLDHLKVDLRDLARAPDVVGSAGAQAFGALADTIDAGNVNVDKLVGSIGSLRLDPTLTPDARHFADGLQLAANEAKKLQDVLTADQGVKSIGPDGQKAVSTLFDVSKGFGDISTKAGGADASIGKMFGTLTGDSASGFGVTRSLATQVFEDIDRSVQRSRQDQLAGMVQLEAQLRSTTIEAGALKQALATSGSKENVQAFFGDVSAIQDANGEIERATSTVTRLFDAMGTGNASVSAVFQGLDMIRAQLTGDGFNTDKVNLFIYSLVRTRMQLDNDIAGARQLDRTIQAIRNRTVTITVATRHVGTGQQSIYDVPGGTVGVTRYGSEGDSSAGFSQQSYSVPTEGGYGSQGGVGSGSGSVTVTRFGGARAAGGPVTAGLAYLIGERGPEIVIPSASATVIPNGMSTPLASPQSAFTGREATREQDRYWTVMMNIEANTRKTAQLLDEIKASAASSSSLSSGGSPYGGGSSSSGGGGGDTSERDAYFNSVFKTAQSNAHAAGIVGAGIVGYGLNGLAATPFQIALKATQAKYGFDTGGIMGPSVASGDSEKVEFFKNPNERVIIARPDQFQDARSQAPSSSASAASQRPVQVNQYITVPGGGTVSKESQAGLRRQGALMLGDALRSLNGR